MRTYNLILFIFFVTSCGQNKDIKLNSNSDTLQVTKRYASNAIREIVIYKDNRPFSNIGFSVTGDTLKIPTALFNDTCDSLFVFFPINKYDRIDLDIDRDSTRTLIGLPIQYRLQDIKHPIMLKVESKMFTGANEIYGAVTCIDTNKYRTSFIFLARQK